MSYLIDYTKTVDIELKYSGLVTAYQHTIVGRVNHALHAVKIVRPAKHMLTVMTRNCC